MAANASALASARRTSAFICMLGPGLGILGP